jgi:hypothetical protein
MVVDNVMAPLCKKLLKVVIFMLNFSDCFSLVRMPSFLDVRVFRTCFSKTSKQGKRKQTPHVTLCSCFPALVGCSSVYH